LKLIDRCGPEEASARRHGIDPTTVGLDPTSMAAASRDPLAAQDVVAAAMVVGSGLSVGPFLFLVINFRKWALCPWKF